MVFIAFPVEKALKFIEQPMKVSPKSLPEKSPQIVFPKKSPKRVFPKSLPKKSSRRVLKVFPKRMFPKLSPQNARLNQPMPATLRHCPVKAGIMWCTPAKTKRQASALRQAKTVCTVCGGWQLSDSSVCTRFSLIFNGFH